MGVSIAGPFENKELKFFVDGIEFHLVRIEPGEFDLGSPPTEEGRATYEDPVRRIRISKAFFIGKYEITQMQYTALMGDNPSRVPGDTLPVNQVSYIKAREFCRRLSERSGLNVMLPTEAQWEYACRAGTKSAYYSGDTVVDLDRVAWFDQNSGGGAHPVGEKEPNAWGLYDMLGNVWEHCLDFLQPYDEIRSVDPVGMNRETAAAMRGGGWMHRAQYCRSATRMWSDERFGGTGIRIVVNPP